MKWLQTLAILFISFPLLLSAQQKTILKGKVHKWVTDTVYVTKLSFHSPYSTWTEHKVIAKDSTFQFEWDKVSEPMVVGIGPLKSFAQQLTDNLLFENLTEEHVMSYCLKHYQNGTTMHYIAPNTTLEVDLIANTWFDTLSDKRADHFRKLGVKIGKNNIVRDYGKTEVRYAKDKHLFANNYFLNFPNQINKIEQAIDTYSSKNMDLAVANIQSAEQHLLADLEKNRDKLSNDLYEYLKGEIKYGAKKELFKYLLLDQPDTLKHMVTTGNIPKGVASIITFEKNSITPNMYKAEMYAEYIEFYLTFVMNVVKSEYKAYRPFDEEKLTVVIEEFPLESAYYYIANNLLKTTAKDQFKRLLPRFLNLFPDGELNEKIKASYMLK